MALASGASVTAAGQAGVCRKTVHRYLAKPAFRPGVTGHGPASPRSPSRR